MEPHGSPAPSRMFWRLALIATLLTLGLIVVGAIVRVTGSGLGCGDDWPLCNGTIFPPLDDVRAWIEWSHRLIVVLIGVFGIGMLVTAARSYRKANPPVLVATVAAAVLYALQSGLGRSVVKAELAPTLVAVHLGVAMLLLGALLAAGILARCTPPERYERDGATLLAYTATALSLGVILTGALVRASTASLACLGWPLCSGVVLPQTELQWIHMIHRYAVVSLGLALVLLAWSVWRNRQSQLVRTVASAALAAYGLQAGIGALFVLSSAGQVWSAAHVGVAAATWGLLVALSVIETVNTQQWQVKQAWAAQSEAVTR